MREPGLKMARYRKKPVEVEAVQVCELIAVAQARWKELPEWFREAYEAGGIVIGADSISIGTLKGTMEVRRDDWIIRGVRGELYPCKPEIFAATYEAVE